MLILINVLNVDWWISWITDSKQCRRGPELFNVKGRSRNCSLGWNLPLFPFRKVTVFEMGIWGFFRVPVKIFRMLDCRTRLLEHSGKCMGYVTLYLSLRATRLRHPSIHCCPFTHSLHYRVSQKLTPFYTFWSLWMHYICDFVSLLCSLI